MPAAHQRLSWKGDGIGLVRCTCASSRAVALGVELRSHPSHDYLLFKGALLRLPLKKANGGGDGIRTHVTVLPVNRFSKPAPSATRPPLRSRYRHIPYARSKPHKAKFSLCKVCCYRTPCALANASASAIAAKPSPLKVSIMPACLNFMLVLTVLPSNFSTFRKLCAWQKRPTTNHVQMIFTA